jgi:hypothetical protein
MADHHRILLNPPPTKKWVTFEDWDEESGLGTAFAAAKTAPMLVKARRHSSWGETGPSLGGLSSSLSSESSLGSTGEGRNNGPPQPAATQQAAEHRAERSGGRRLAEGEEEEGEGEEEYEDELRTRAPIFNASFGGYRLNGEAAMMKTVWGEQQQQLPQQLSRFSRLSASSSVSSIESELAASSSPLRTTSPSSRGLLTGQGTEQAGSWVRFTALDEKKTVSEAELGEAEGRRTYFFIIVILTFQKIITARNSKDVIVA